MADNKIPDVLRTINQLQEDLLGSANERRTQKLDAIRKLIADHTLTKRATTVAEVMIRDAKGGMLVVSLLRGKNVDMKALEELEAAIPEQVEHLVEHTVIEIDKMFTDEEIAFIMAISAGPIGASILGKSLASAKRILDMNGEFISALQGRISDILHEVQGEKSSGSDIEEGRCDGCGKVHPFPYKKDKKDAAGSENPN